MSKKILIIDDDPLIRSTLTQSFQLQGLQANSADDGTTGLDAVNNWQPDLILLDHHMPSLTGIEFLKKLRANPAVAGIKVIYLTSDADIAHVNEALSLGVRTYLNKSEVEIQDIANAVLREL